MLAILDHLRQHLCCKEPMPKYVYETFGMPFGVDFVQPLAGFIFKNNFTMKHYVSFLKLYDRYAEHDEWHELYYDMSLVDTSRVLKASSKSQFGICFYTLRITDISVSAYRYYQGKEDIIFMDWKEPEE